MPLPLLCQVSSGLAAPEQGLGSARHLPEQRGPVQGDAVQGCRGLGESPPLTLLPRARGLQAAQRGWGVDHAGHTEQLGVTCKQRGQ